MAPKDACVLIAALCEQNYLTCLKLGLCRHDEINDLAMKRLS